MTRTPATDLHETIPDPAQSLKRDEPSGETVPPSGEKQARERPCPAYRNHDGFLRATFRRMLTTLDTFPVALEPGLNSVHRMREETVA
jgi:hypothetical protein